MPLSTFLNGRSYTTLRGAAWLALSETGHVVAGSVTDDGGGGGSATWTAGSSVPCRIDPLYGRGEGVVAARISERSTHAVTLPPNMVVDAGQRFAIDGRGTFEITAVRERTSEFTRTIEVAET